MPQSRTLCRHPPTPGRYARGLRRVLMDGPELSPAGACDAAIGDQPNEVYFDNPKGRYARPPSQSPVDFAGFKDVFDIVKHVISAAECTQRFGAEFAELPMSHRDYDGIVAMRF